MQKIKMDMDPGAYLIRWTGGGASPALIWQTESGERMICCSNWISPAKLANMAGAEVSSMDLIALWAHEDAPQPVQPGYDVQRAATEYRVGRYKDLGIEPQYVWYDVDAAFAAGAAWQKERDTAAHNTLAELAETALDGGIAFQDEMRNAIGTLGEGMAELMRKQDELQAAGYRGADRGVAILKHLQEIGDNVRGVSGAIGDKFGVVLDAVKDVGEKVEACMTIASNTEEGLSVSIEKLDKLGVEKWREAIKHVEAEGITEPMHARVKASGYYDPGNLKPLAADESGLGKLWADVTVNLEDVSDETLRALAVSGQISEARYFEEYSRRHPKHVGVDPAHGADAMAYTFMRDGKTLGTIKDLGPTSEVFQAWSSGTGLILVAYRGDLYTLQQSPPKITRVEIVA